MCLVFEVFGVYFVVCFVFFDGGECFVYLLVEFVVVLMECDVVVFDGECEVIGGVFVGFGGCVFVLKEVDFFFVLVVDEFCVDGVVVDDGDDLFVDEGLECVGDLVVLVEF